MSDYNTCDCCNTSHPSIDLFWNCPETVDMSKEQLKICDYMQLKEYVAVCEQCYYTIKKLLPLTF